MDPRKKSKKQPDVHRELDGFEININSFGQIESNYKIENLRKFLDEKVDDKKLQGTNIQSEEE